MKQSRPTTLALLLREFFASHLPNVRGMSPHTIKSYRDSLVLLLRFVAEYRKRSVTGLDLEDLQPREIEPFLAYLEEKRSNSGATRNIRLSAIHSFFRFVATQHPQKLEQAQRVLAIPFKKTRTRLIDYLEYDEIQQILSVIDRTTPKGRRDYTLLATMFNTGARVQEILDLRACDLQLIKPFQLRLTGKGRKQGGCPLWPQTAQLLRQLCTELNIAATSETRIFQNRWNAPLTRFGVRHILKMCLAQAQASIATLRSKRLHPHSMRHSTAIALLKSGVDLSTIAQWLGHASIETTNRYAAIDLEMKRKAIANIKPLQGSQNRSRQSRLKQSVLEWLEAL